MKKIQIVEITTPYRPELKDRDGNITQAEVLEVSNILIHGGHTYQEELSLAMLDPEDTQEIKSDKKNKRILTAWEQMSEEEQLDDYSTRRSIAYNLQLKELQRLLPNKNLVVRISE